MTAGVRQCHQGHSAALHQPLEKGPGSCHPTNAISTRHLGCSHNEPSLLCPAKTALQTAKLLPTTLPGSETISAISVKSSSGSGSACDTRLMMKSGAKGPSRSEAESCQPLQQKRDEWGTCSSNAELWQGDGNLKCVGRKRRVVIQVLVLFPHESRAMSKQVSPAVVLGNAPMCSHGGKITLLDGTATPSPVHSSPAGNLPSLPPSLKSLFKA